jgi:type II secretory pathway pseudopilin PulG
MIAILAAIAVPVYTNKIERTRGERAIANIELIADAMKIYRVKNGSFYFCTNGQWNVSPAFPNINNSSTNHLNDINTNLNLELSDSNFYYNINRDGNWYDIYVVRIGTGSYANYRLMYGFAVNTNQEGWETFVVSPMSNWPWQPTTPAY